DATRNHLAAVRDERAQHLGVLVVDLLKDLVGEQLAARRTTAALATAAIVAVAVESFIETSVHTGGHGLLLLRFGLRGRLGGRLVGEVISAELVIVIVRRRHVIAAARQEQILFVSRGLGGLLERRVVELGGTRLDV